MNVLFTSPFCLLDPSSGASISCRTILEGLAERGHSVFAVSSTIFDRPRYPAAANFLQHVRAAPMNDTKGNRTPFWKVAAGKVTYFIAPSPALRRLHMPCQAEDAYQGLVKLVAPQVKTDIVLTYGAHAADRDTLRWLRDQGIPIVFYLANGNYWSADNFRDCNLIMTDTHATANLYKERLGLDIVPMGKFIERVAQPDESADCVTFINPAPEKGAAIFAAVARDAAQRGLSVRFLVVESRALLTDVFKKLSVDMSTLPPIERVPLQDDMSAVWRRTRVLIHPSLWHESGSRVVLEACSAGIPVMATASGGVPEILGEGGFQFPVPEANARAYLTPIADEIAREWGNVLEKLLTDEKFYAKARKRALKNWKTTDYRGSIPAVEAKFQDIVSTFAK